MSVRTLLRRGVPFAVRWRLRLARRHLEDRRAGTRLATGRGDPASYPYPLCHYERPLICYPGQEGSFAAKRENNERALRGMDRIVIRSGETFSFWSCVGRPTEERGYGRAAALKNRLQTEDVGGALCLASTLLYNIGLLGGMTIVERRCHSVDQYGDARYFELGRDAAVEYAYLDLRFRNDLPEPFLVRTNVCDDALRAEAWTPTPLSLAVTIEVGPPRHEPPPAVVTVDRTLPAGESMVDDAGLPGLAVHTRRTVNLNGASHADDLGWSVHHPHPRLVRVGT